MKSRALAISLVVAISAGSASAQTQLSDHAQEMDILMPVCATYLETGDSSKLSALGTKGYRVRAADQTLRADKAVRGWTRADGRGEIELRLRPRPLGGQRSCDFYLSGLSANQAKQQQGLTFAKLAQAGFQVAPKLYPGQGDLKKGTTIWGYTVEMKSVYWLSIWKKK